MTRAFGGFSSSAMGRRPYVQAHRRRHRTAPMSSLLPVVVADNRNPVSSVLSSVCSREEKDSSFPHSSSNQPTNVHLHHHLLPRRLIEPRRRPPPPPPPQARRLFSTAGSFSAPLTHRTTLDMLHERPMPSSYPSITSLSSSSSSPSSSSSSSLPHQLQAVMALLQPLLAPTSTRHDDKLSHRVVTTARRKLTLPERIPRGAWDSHMHVVDPAAYPLAKDAVYCPKTHRLDQALSFESSVGIDNIVLVQPSIYGYDNTCLLDALRALGPRRGRAVVAFEPGSLSESTLREWHRLGVRGVRINLSSVGKSLDARELRELLHRYALDCKPLDWVIQLYMPMSMIELLEPVVPTLGVRVCIDHLGHPCVKDMPSEDPYNMPGFASLAKLLRAGNTYVKLSAPYRLSSRADHSDLEPIAREVLRLRGRDRVIFATDWPHTRFEGLDIRPWMETVLDWCGKDDVLTDRLFRGNAEDLWNARRER